jgi:hypothetical protein
MGGMLLLFAIRVLRRARDQCAELGQVQAESLARMVGHREQLVRGEQLKAVRNCV